jgi:hypothetical protein
MIDLLTIVIGIVRITKDGFINFTSKHNRKVYDHMCIKAFNNEEFYYYCVHVSDI